MTKTEIITAIKEEARIPVGTDLDAMITGIINRKLQSKARIYKYSELKIEGEVVTLIDATGEYALPDDYLELLGVQFGYTEDAFYPLDRLWNDEYQRMHPSSSGPLWFTIVGDKIRINPYADILSSHFLKVDYIIDPLSIFEDGDDVFPIPSIEEQIILETVARIAVYENSERAAAYQKLANNEISGVIHAAK